MYGFVTPTVSAPNPKAIEATARILQAMYQSGKEGYGVAPTTLPQDPTLMNPALLGFAATPYTSRALRSSLFGFAGGAGQAVDELGLGGGEKLKNDLIGYLAEGPAGMEMGVPMMAAAAPEVESAQAAKMIETPTVAAPQGILAEHSSPHNFDKFDINKIGTGYGKANYGAGLYFSEIPGSTKTYRRLWPGENTRTYDVRLNAHPEDFIDTTLPAHEQSPQILQAMERLGYSKPTPLPRKPNPNYEADLARYNNLGDERYPGEYDLWKPDKYAPQEWEVTKPNGEVSTIEAQPSDPNGTSQLRKMLLGHYKPGGASAKEQLQNIKQSAEAGIKGYRDSGTTIVYDDKIIEILKKYGLIGGAALAPSLLQNNKAQASQRKPYGMAR